MIFAKVQRVTKVRRMPMECECKADRHLDRICNSDKLCSTVERAAARLCCDDEWSARKDHRAIFPATIYGCQSIAGSRASLATTFTIFRRNTVRCMNSPLDLTSSRWPGAKQVRAESYSRPPPGGMRTCRSMSNRKCSARVFRGSPTASLRDGTIAIPRSATSTICSPTGEADGRAFPRKYSKSCTRSRLFTKRSIRRRMMSGEARPRYRSSREVSKCDIALWRSGLGAVDGAI